jgi:hypothetical protein
MDKHDHARINPEERFRRGPDWIHQFTDLDKTRFIESIARDAVINALMVTSTLVVARVMRQPAVFTRKKKTLVSIVRNVSHKRTRHSVDL